MNTSCNRLSGIRTFNQSVFKKDSLSLSTIKGMFEAFKIFILRSDGRVVARSSPDRKVVAVRTPRKSTIIITLSDGPEHIR